MKVFLLAAVISVAVAVLDASPATASYRCTHYAPVNYWVDFNCWVSQEFINQTYQTTDVAIRDSNHIYITPSANWALCYVINNECWYYTFGYGDGGSQGNSGGNYAYAYCEWNGSGTKYGYCTTVWHG